MTAAPEKRYLTTEEAIQHAMKRKNCTRAEAKALLAQFIAEGQQRYTGR